LGDSVATFIDSEADESKPQKQGKVEGEKGKEVVAAKTDLTNFNKCDGDRQDAEVEQDASNSKSGTGEEWE
jgi:hypothetical protein